MSTPVLVFFWSVVSVLALVSFVRLYLWLVARYLHENEGFDEIHIATTPDNWRLALRRFRPRGTPLGGAPVLLCHGICANHRTFDLTPNVSLARFLAARGHDVWVASLRTTRASHRVSRFGLADGRATFDDLANLDAPVLIDTIRRATGVGAVIWVGHSLGGHVGLAHASRSAASGIRAIATLATSADFTHASALRFAALPSFISALPTRLLARLVAPFASLLAFPPLSHLFNTKSISSPLLRRAIFHTSEDLPVPLLNQLRRWSTTTAWPSASGDFDYRTALHALKLPAFIGIAPSDRLCPRSAYEQLFDEIGSRIKTVTVLGRAEGLGRDYGHVDLLMSQAAPAEVYPRLAEWIEAEQGLSPVREKNTTRASAAKSSTDAPSTT